MAQIITESNPREISKHWALAMAYGMGRPLKATDLDIYRSMMQEYEPRRATVAIESNETRFRSFAERYVIARAPSFRPGLEEEDQWTCMLNAKSAYKKIAAMGQGITAEELRMENGQLPAPTQGGACATATPYSHAQNVLSRPNAPPSAHETEQAKQLGNRSWTDRLDAMVYGTIAGLSPSYRGGNRASRRAATKGTTK